MTIRGERGQNYSIKMLIGGVFVLALIGLATCSLLESATKKTLGMDSEKAKEVAESLVRMQELPDHYQYVWGVKILGDNPVVLIRDKKSEISWSILRMSNIDPRQNAEAILKMMARRGMPTSDKEGKQVQKGIKIEEEGKMKVGGREIAYVIGTADIEKDSRNPAFLACVKPKEQTATVIFGAADDPYNFISPASAGEFLDYIERFK